MTISRPLPGVSIESGSYGLRAVVTSAWSEAIERYLREKAVAEIELNHAKGWHGSTLAFFFAALLMANLVLTSEVAQAAIEPTLNRFPTFSSFGIGGDAHTGQNLTNWIPQMAAIGIHMMRCCYPEQMDYLSDRNIKFGGLLYSIPPGDTLDAAGTLPVKDLPAWSAYVTDRVKQFKGRVKYWELWNEPPNGIGPGQTAADYGRLLVSTYDAAKAADPACWVGMAAKSVHVNWLEQTIKAGGKDHFDYIVLHPYETLGCAVDHPGAEPIFMSIVPTVRKMLAAQDPDKVNVPIICTELGYDAGRGANLQGYAVVKAYTMGIAQGIACIEWFEGIDGDSGPMGLLQADGTPRPSYTAMAQMIKYLGQHPAYLGWVLLNGKDYGFVFRGEKHPILITWAKKGTTDLVDFGRIVPVVEPLTGHTSRIGTCTLTEAPVIVDGAPDDLIQQARDNLTRPFPWDGDYTGAKSVSVTYGVTNVEKGLHTQSAAAIAADVIAYGGSARAGGVPGGNVFMVDPNFLSYTSTPIEISIVVRRDAANDNAGFKLNYESTSGYKNFGWYTVPDNLEWHTVKWKITDAEFVSMWGFNFSLDSDGDQYNKYDIQSVTVTKLDK
jgi:polysaccharide biosynthesis protein PslG